MQKSYLFYMFSILILFIGIKIAFSLIYIIDQEKSINNGNYPSEENEGNYTLNILLKEQNVFKSRFMKLLELTRLNEGYFNKTIKKKINQWKNSSYPYIDIERFSIPIISTISAGKSSFLNFLLNLKNSELQTGEGITTKICVIVRHKKGEKKENFIKLI